MDKTEFEADLRREGYRVVNSSVKPNLVAPNHCHDFDAKAFVLGGEITITRDNCPTTFRTGECFEVPTGCMHAEHVGPEGVALLSGRRRTGPLTREAFESDLRREGVRGRAWRSAARLLRGVARPRLRRADHGAERRDHPRPRQQGRDIPRGRPLRDRGGMPAHHAGGPGRGRLHRRQGVSPGAHRLRPWRRVVGRPPIRTATPDFRTGRARSFGGCRRPVLLGRR